MPLKEDGCTCHQCQSTYKVDMVLPDDMWNRIARYDGEMLCGRCICARLETLDEFGAYQLIDLARN